VGSETRYSISWTPPTGPIGLFCATLFVLVHVLYNADAGDKSWSLKCSLTSTIWHSCQPEKILLNLTFVVLPFMLQKYDSC
jgi:hypothetical protein